jgi:hypothetical protein
VIEQRIARQDFAVPPSLIARTDEVIEQVLSFSSCVAAGAQVSFWPDSVIGSTCA